jgi:hypothetical protein
MNRLSVVFKSRLVEFIKIGLIALLIISSTYLRYRLLDEAGGDLSTYRQAVTEFISGVSPYKYTVKSFTRPELDLDHGYAYFPTLLYIYTPLYKLHVAHNIPLQRAWKSAMFLAEIGVALILIKLFYKKDYLACLVGLAMWLFNPFLIARNSYVYTEPFGILFMLLALYYLEKNDFWTGVFFAISFSFKAFPVILFPMFFIKSRKKLLFLAGGASVALLISIPFMKSFESFLTYIQGAILVHGVRDPQGRPILFMVNNLLGLSLYSLELAAIYKYLSIILGWLVTSYLLLKKKVVDKYVLSVISFSLFYLFTPVLARTYMLWFIPVYVIGMYEVFKDKKRIWYYLSLIAFYAFYATYLFFWYKGVRIVDGVISL